MMGLDQEKVFLHFHFDNLESKSTQIMFSLSFERTEHVTDFKLM